jgi:hypothetical protein
MAISTQWFNNDPRILLTTFQGEHTLNDYMDTVVEQRKMLNDLGRKVHLVYVFQFAPKFPRAGITTLSRIALTPSPFEGAHIVVGQHLFFRSILSILSKIAPAQHKHFTERVQFARTIGDALTLIERFDEVERGAAQV